MRIPRRMSSGAASSRRSKPFWSVRRPIAPRINAGSPGSKPAIRHSSARHSAFPRRSSTAVMSGKVRVVRGAPDRRVDAVQDPDDTVSARVEEGLEADASLFRADLVRVRGGDCGDHVGGHDCALEKVHVAAQPDGAARPRGVGKAEDGELLAAVDALVVEVVDREDGRDVVEPAVAPVAPRAEHRGERGMPVVRVEDSWPPVEPLQGLDRGPDEEREAPEPVVPALVVRRVDLAAVEERVVRDEVDRHDAAGQQVPEEAHRSAGARGSRPRTEAAPPRARCCAGGTSSPPRGGTA